MIVVCPSCQTRYRHDFEPAARPGSAECSRCEETIPLVEPRRTYVLVPAGADAPAATVPRPAGMDDPTLAGRLQPAAVDLPEPAPDVEGAEGGRGWWRAEAVELGMALSPAAVGAGMAYYLAVRQSQDPVTWSALGGAAGLLIGWACLLWTQRHR